MISTLCQLEEALLAFQERYEKSAAPFQWTFTREDWQGSRSALTPSALPRQLDPSRKYVTLIQERECLV